MRGAISSPHAEATRAGAQALRDGGNAIDAALAAAAVLSVVYPHQTALGGDMFALVDDGTRVQAVNGSGRLPRAATLAAMTTTEGEVVDHGVHSATVPGVVAGWQSLMEMGAALDWPRLLAPAIRATEGTTVTASLAAAIAERAAVLSHDPGMRELFLPGGSALPVGSVLAQPALGRSLRNLAAQGAEAFYRGQLGRDLVTGLQALGSPLQMRDLESHATTLDTPLQLDYGQAQVLTSPPNSHGFVLLEALAALQACGVAADDPAETLAPAMLHALLLATADREAFLADPEYARMPLAELFDPHNLRARMARLRDRGVPAHAFDRHIPAHGDTVAVCAMDEQGRSVSLIQSVFQSFGAGVLEPATGIILHNRARGFSLRPGAANPPVPGMRPAHTLMPLLIRRHGRSQAALGTMGGRAQPQILMQILAAGLRLEQALAPILRAPRWVFGARDVGLSEPGLMIEADASDDLEQHLHTAGLPMRRIPARSEVAGHTNAVRRHRDGRFEAATDPRSDGLAQVVD
ncbi:MAG: gamma-glutamyltransferase [Pseudomonas sp.]